MATTQELALGGLVNQITPTGGVRAGTFDAQGNFVPNAGQVGIQQFESPFLQQLRQGSEAAQLGLLGQIGGLSGLRSADVIRGILPSAQGTTEGLPGLFGLGQVQSGLTTPFSQDFAGEGAKLEQATFDRVANLLSPRFEEQSESLEQTLANKGIPIGSEAFEREKNRLEEQQSRILQDTGFQAVSAGRQEQERLSRLGLSTRGQQLGEGLSLADLSGSQRGQLFGENRAQLSDALNKQLSLSDLELRQRQQQFGEVGGVAGLARFQQPQIPGNVGDPAGTAALLGQQKDAAQGQLFGTLGALGLDLLRPTIQSGIKKGAQSLFPDFFGSAAGSAINPFSAGGGGSVLGNSVGFGSDAAGTTAAQTVISPTTGAPMSIAGGSSVNSFSGGGFTGLDTLGGLSSAAGSAAGFGGLSELGLAGNAFTGGQGVFGLGSTAGGGLGGGAAGGGLFGGGSLTGLLGSAGFATLAPLALMAPGLLNRKPPRAFTEVDAPTGPLQGVSRFGGSTPGSRAGLVNQQVTLADGTTQTIQDFNPNFIPQLMGGQAQFDPSTGQLIAQREQTDRLGNQNFGITSGGTTPIDEIGTSSGLGAITSPFGAGGQQGFTRRIDELGQGGQVLRGTGQMPSLGNLADLANATSSSAPLQVGTPQFRQANLQAAASAGLIQSGEDSPGLVSARLRAATPEQQQAFINIRRQFDPNFNPSL